MFHPKSDYIFGKFSTHTIRKMPISPKKSLKSLKLDPLKSSSTQSCGIIHQSSRILFFVERVTACPRARASLFYRPTAFPPFKAEFNRQFSARSIILTAAIFELWTSKLVHSVVYFHHGSVNKPRVHCAVSMVFFMVIEFFFVLELVLFDGHCKNSIWCQYCF